MGSPSQASEFGTESRMIGDRLEMCLNRPKEWGWLASQPKVVVEDLRSFFVGELRHVDDDLSPVEKRKGAGFELIVSSPVHVVPRCDNEQTSCVHSIARRWRPSPGVKVNGHRFLREATNSHEGGPTPDDYTSIAY